MKLLKTNTIPMLRSSMPMLSASDGQPAERTGDARVRMKLYQSHKWRAAAHAFLLRHPYCVRCGAKANTVDHTLGHEGDWLSRFWNHRLWQAMCTQCHSSKTAATEGGLGNPAVGRRPGGGMLEETDRRANQALPSSVREIFPVEYRDGDYDEV